MNEEEVYIVRPTGMTLVKYKPKRWWHLHLVDVFFLCVLSAFAGAILYGLLTAYYFPVPPCPKCD